MDLAETRQRKAKAQEKGAAWSQARIVGPLMLIGMWDAQAVLLVDARQHHQTEVHCLITRDLCRA
jgi:hypothetical protein